MIVKYITIVTDNLEEETVFFSSVLGFSHAGVLELWPGTSCSLFSMNDRNMHIALIPRSKQPDNGSLVILNTDNCLRDFQTLTKTGTQFKTGLQYRPVGLSAEFEDTAGNHFILLEEREYEQI